MATPWWAKVSPDYYKRPSNLGAAVSPRARHMAAVIADTHLPDQPDVAGVFLNAKVPYAVAQRADMQYRKQQAQITNDSLNNAGLGGAVPRGTSRIVGAERRQKELETANYWDMSWDQIGEGFNEAIAKPIGSAIDAFQGIGKSAATSVMRAGGALFSPVSVPSALGRANESTIDPNELGGRAKAYQALVAKGANPTIASVIAFGEKRDPLIGGVTGLLGITDLSPTQRQDMQKHGYDPDTFGGRWSWYYDSIDTHQKAVADSDVARFSQEFNPQSVQAVREILTSNALDDGDVSGLTEDTQKFIMDLQSDQGDPRNKELFKRMSASSTLHTGSIVSDIIGLPRGEDANNLVSALSDLAIYWYADPLAAGTRGLNAFRVAQRGVSAGHLGSMENQLLALKVPGDLTSEAATAAGKSFRKMIDTADQLNNYERALARPGLTAEEATRFEVASKNIQQKFDIQHPELSGQLTATRNILNGKLDAITIKSDERMRAAKAQAVQEGKEFSPLDFLYPTKPGKVQLRIRRDADGKPLNEDLNQITYELTKRMGHYIVAEALNSGRPIINGMVQLPGEIAVNRRIRAAVAPMRDFLVGSDKRLGDLIAGKGKGQSGIDFNGQFDKMPDMVLSTKGGEWIKQNYREKFTAGAERVASNIGTHGEMKLNPLDPASTKAYTQFLIPWFGRDIAYIMGRKWAGASPGERVAQWRQTAEALETAAGFKTKNPMVREFLAQFKKGITPTFDKQGRMIGPNEAYTAEKADNTIKAGGVEIAAGIWPWQMADHITMPPLRAMRQMTEKTGVLSAVTGMFNSRAAMVPTSIWKVGKVGNPGNMGRQNLELWGLGTAEQGVKYLMDMMSMRRYVAGETIAARMAKNNEARAANQIYKEYGGKNEWAQLNDLQKTGNKQAYVNKLQQLYQANGAHPGIARTLANWNEDVWIGDMVKYGLTDRAALQIARPVDMLRKLRLQLPRKSPETFDTPWQRAQDVSFVDGQLKAALGDLGGQTDQALMMLGQSAADDVAEAAARGIAGVPVVVKNGRTWMGAGGDSGARTWHAQFDSRQTDEFNAKVMQAVAMDTLIRRGNLPAIPGQAGPHASDLINYHLAQQGKNQLYPPGLGGPQEIAEYLIKNDPLGGAILRNHNMRLFHNDDAYGSVVSGSQQEAEAMKRLAQTQVRDSERHMGADPTKNRAIPTEYDDILRKVALGDRVTLDDLSKIPDKLRPQEIVTNLYMPGVQKFDANTAVNLASKAYAFTVARPLMRLGITPAFLANRNIALRAMEPAAVELKARGFTDGQIEGFLEAGASKYAVNATFRYTDEVASRSYFSEMNDNFLMFQRAAEDFIRRFMRVTNAKPSVLSRAYLLAEAAQHSGIIYPQTETDDEGNRETHLVFTFPGSGIMAKAIQETGKSLGWGDSDLILKPLYSSMTSQVRFVNPSISNPLGFSTSPLVGMPLRIVRAIFPETDHSITGTLAALEGGGERFFAEQGPVQSLLPTPLSRLASAVGWDNKGDDGQIASATRNAMAFMVAAGLAPGDDATKDEIEEAHQSLREQAVNQLVWRAVVGTFSPWAPQYADPEDLGLPEVDPFTHAQGINSLKGEWFEVIHQAVNKFGSHAGIGEAYTEWYRRHPDGASIVNPAALTVGTSRPPGTAENAGYFKSGPELVAWMMANKDWMEKNRAVAYYLMPEFNEPDFSSQGWRDQLRNGLREHKTEDEFYRDVRYAVTSKEYWDKLKERSKALGSGADKKTVYEQFDKWEASWRLAHPATADEIDRRQDPNYVHGTVAPALEKLVHERQADSPIDLSWATKVYNHYSRYRDKYNQTQTGDDGKYDRSRLNKQYRDDGDKMFLGTPAETLWKAMDVNEGGF